MASVTVAELQAVLDADWSRWKTSFDQASAKVDELDKKTQSGSKSVGDALGKIGDSATKFVTLPLVGAGAAATKFAMDFETNMSHVEGLVGITGKELDGMRQSILGMGHDVGQGPVALSDALYFVTSAGIKGQAALDTVEVSAKAASAGLGKTGEVADAVSSTLNAYATSGLTAAQSTDILVNTVKEGKIEADQLAGVIGNVIPIASAAGVSFDQVGAAMALISRNGSDAAESATQVRAIIDAIVKPSKQAAKELDGVGLSTGQLQQSLKNDGLLATLRLLQQHFGDNNEAVAKWAGRIEALNGYLSITHGDATEVDRVFKSLKDSTGSLDTAFDSASKTTGFKMKQAFADLQTAGVQVGSAVTPILSTLAGAVGDVAQKFGELAPEQQAFILGIGGVVAAIGPGIKAVQGLQSVYGDLKKVLESSAGPYAAAAAGIGLLVGYQWMEHAKNVREAAERQQQLADALRQVHDPAQVAADDFQKLADKLNGLKPASDGAKEAVAQGPVAALKKQFADKGLLDDVNNLGLSFEELVQVTSGGTDVFQRFANNLTQPIDKMGNLSDAQRHVLETLQGAVGQYGKVHLGDVVHELDQAADAWDDNRRKQDAAAKSLVDAAVASHTLTQAYVDQQVALVGAGDKAQGYSAIAQGLRQDQEYARLASEGVVEVMGVSLPPAADKAGAAVGNAGVAGDFKDAAQEAKDAAAEAKALQEAIDKIARSAQEYASTADAGRRIDDDFQKSINALNDQLSKNGVALQGSTDQAIDNRASYDSLVDVAGKRIAQMISEGDNIADIKAKAEEYKQKLLTLADAHGIDHDKMQPWLQDIDGAITKSQTVAQTLGAIPQIVTTDIIINSDPALQAIDQFRQALAQAGQDTSFFMADVGSLSGLAGSAGAGGLHAYGGTAMPGDTFIVGERGPEMITLGSSPAFITPNSGMGDSGGGYGPAMNVTVNVSGVVGDPRPVARVIREEIRKLERGAV